MSSPATAAPAADAGIPVGVSLARRLSWRAEAWLARGVLELFRRLEPARASDLGGRFCAAIGPLLPVSRIADANLRLALPELDAAARRRVVRAVWDNLGRTVAEFPHLPDLRRDTPSGPGWLAEGGEILDAQRSRGGPVLFVSGHLGNWEMLPPAVAAHGLPFASFYRAAGNPRVDRLIRQLRERAIDGGVVGGGAPLFAKGARGARGALAHVLRGGSLGMLVDQKMNDGVEATLFGLPAMTAPALATIALKRRCPVIPGRVERLGPARLRLVVEAPLVLPDTGDPALDQRLLVQRINDMLERWIRADPGSWLWLHRRFPKPLYRAVRG